jgi:hypothetical protein
VRAAGALIVLLSSLILAPGAASDASPSITVVIRGTVGTNGWFRSNVIVNWVLTPFPDSAIGCDPAITLTADTAGTDLTCTASWGSTKKSDTETIKIDKTPPAVRGAANRVPDANGWYNRPVTVAFSGTDATSGVTSCSSAGYSGPDGAGATVAGTCTDRAGNVGRGAVAFKYDATAPTLGAVKVVHGNRNVELRWVASADTQRVEVVRSSGRSKGRNVVYTGTAKTYRDKRVRIGATYRYTVSAFDQASNSAVRTVTAVGTGPLLSPVPGGRVSGRPTLTWTPVRGASYYNVQLVRGNRILSVWPTGPKLTLAHSWVFQGHRYRLRRGVYRWYVWPGFGRLAAARYGHRLGGSSFVFAG